MLTHRFLMLACGPPLLLSLSYWAARPQPTVSSAVAAMDALPQLAAPVHTASDAALEAATQSRAAAVGQTLGTGFHVIARAPFVLAGDMTELKLDRIARTVILPTAMALSTTYFDQPPDEPIAVIVCSDDGTYRELARRFDNRDVFGYYGYYVRADRRLMLNLATGYGTLGHELTHALSHFDCPTLPTWFDEGLAALHEQCEFSADGLQLEGQFNWRGPFLQQALQQGSLHTLEQFLAAGQIRPDHESEDYAHARGLCLYLQRRQLLAHYYRKLRRNVATDPTGLITLRQLLQVATLDEVEADFRTWIRESLR